MLMMQKPAVLVVAGLDPSGGAGIQADIQAITALGAHPLPIISCLTVQDTRDVRASVAVDAELIRRQLQCLDDDIDFAAVKTGALGDAAIVRVLASFLKARPTVPLIVDPVIRATGGGSLADDALIDALRNDLFPLAELATPNGPELTRLGESDDPFEAADRLLHRHSLSALLTTGGHGSGETLINRLEYRNGNFREWTLRRLPGEYHGSGCTFAAAIAARRASGDDLETAISRAQRYVSESLTYALDVGKGHPIPHRINYDTL